MKKVFLFLSLFIVSTNLVVAQTITVDSSFGNNGIAISDAGSGQNVGTSIIMQPDGKIITAGTSLNYEKSDSIIVIRYNVDGSLDNSFGNNGIVRINNGTYIPGAYLTLQNDGKIIVCGTIYHKTTLDQDFALYRLTQHGNIDSSFGTNGNVETDFYNRQELGSCVSLQSDQKILVGGRTNAEIGKYYFALARYNKNGDIDSSFGVNGKTVIENNPGDNWSRAMTILNDGKIIQAGYTKSSLNADQFDIAVAKFNSNGNIDSSFGVNGSSVINFGNTNSYAYAVAIQSDGRIVIVGSHGEGQTANVQNHDSILIIRLTTDGFLDNSFGTNGIVTTYIGSNCAATSVHILQNKSLIVGGLVDFTYTSGDFILLGYNESGKLDSSFGVNGFIRIDLSGLDDGSFSSFISPAGKIIMAGYSAKTGNKRKNFGLTRFNFENVLPLQLLSFSANHNGKTNLLKWSTVQELNTERFEIQRSSNSRDFVSIGTVKSLNNGKSKNDYVFTDAQPLKPINYYRLKMIDKDGKFSYSATRNINNRSSFDVMIYPNPVHQNLTLSFNTEKAMDVQIEIVNAEGKKMYAKKLQLPYGTSMQSINVAAFGIGNYFVKCITTNEQTGLKFAKQ